MLLSLHFFNWESFLAFILILYYDNDRIKTIGGSNMKKWSLIVLSLCLLVGLTVLAVPHAKAAEGHTHCVCGGSAVGVHDHKCEVIEWKPLSSVVSLTAVDWKNVPSGNYYLDGDVKVTGVTDGNAIGQITKNSDGSYSLTEARTISLCLNGHTISTTKDRVFKGVYMQSVLNICDCSGKQVNGTWQWEGKIVGGTTATGGIAYTYANSTTNIYGGNLKAKDGQTAATGGGLFFVAQDRSIIENTAGQKDAAYASTLNIYNGNLYGGSSAKNGGNIYVAHHSCLNVYGGCIHDGTAAQKGGNIYSGGSAKVTIQNASIYGGYPEVAKVITDGVASVEYTLADAVKNYKDGSVIRLYKDLETELTIHKNIMLDLNGHDLAGVSGDFTCFDSATKQDTQAGVLSCTGKVNAADGYVALSAENGISFYYCVPEITHLSIDPAKTAIGYKANITGKSILDQVEKLGLEMWLEGYDHRQFSKEFDGQLTLRLKNILSLTNTDEQNAVNANTPVYAFAYAVLKDGTKLCGDTVAYSFKDMLHAADDCYASFNATQKEALQSMAGKYSRIMMTWDVENFHHADGGMWTNVTKTGFLGKLSQDGDYWKIKPGSYVLTEDVDILGRTLKIASGDTVNICLNGHTITGSKRMMRIYGTLNLCDCHSHGEAEGGMTSSFTAEAGHGAVFYTYYGSTFNLYGGNLKATGKLRSSGVGAVSHENRDNMPDVPAGIMNMYGGTLSGGNATGNGGLLAVYQGAAFHMYGGEMYDGQAGSHGGSIYCAGEGSVDLQGGQIHDCDSPVGSVYLSGEGTYCIGNAQISDEVYINNAALVLRDAPQIEKLYLPYTAQLNTDHMTTGAQIELTSDVHGLLSNNTELSGCFILDEGYTPAVINGKLVAVMTGVSETAQESGFRVGYSSVCIDPAQATDIPLSGFGNSADRTSTEIQESLYASATAITDAEDNTVLLITCDLQRPQEAITDVIREHVSRATGVPFENVILSASHSHSTPDLYSGNALIKEYKLLLYNNFTQAAIQAMASRVPATIRAGVVDEVKDPNSGKYMNFTRHYYYEDASGNRTYWGDNFGSAPSGISSKQYKHVAAGDHSMQLIRFVREGQKDVLLCNWAAHPTMTGGAEMTVLSADYVGPLRDKVQAEGDCYFAFVQGAAGNMNPTSRISGETPYDKAHYHEYGEALAQVVLEHKDSLTSVASGKVRTMQTDYAATVFKHTDEEVAKATEFRKLTYEEQKAQYKDWGYTSIYHASSIISKANLGVTEDLELNAISIGNSIAFYSAPGELWAETGMTVKDSSPFAYTFTTGYTNGDWKYFTDGAAADGTYESYEGFYTRFVAPDTTNAMIAWWKEALETLHSQAQ